ncbi:MAG: putative ubiquitin-conjugating enzyme e2 j2 [Streblomastix strix]|uniref:Putative ubiquitin-conjugating enzyme e2 j2 n=1 Tax=Streblomastix strix TaxID=222440 RepID=A0A5J4WS94_9EUKA|nr:MAG: putative ubiquitin-conjugating enzyme e2 j2 [Streblomastix strix]
MSNKLGISRLQKELQQLNKDPISGIIAIPDPKNIYTWHYIIQGPPTTPYEGGQYHGVLIFPSNYPFAGPQIIMYTPNGRFETGTPICTTNSNLHPEQWSTSWSCSSILLGIQSFMCQEEAGIGYIKSSSKERKKLALESITFNKKDPTYQKYFN